MATVMVKAFDFDYLRKDLKEAFGSHWALNDAAHREEHFEAVYQTGFHINEQTGWNWDPKDILFAAYFHDLFAWTRVNHHELSYHYFMSADHPVILGHYDNNRRGRINVALGCLEHRASFVGEFTNGFAELINSADRGMPGNVQGLIQRCYDHRLTTMPNVSSDERMAAAIAFLKKKSGSKGYARYPDLYKQVFGEQLAEQQAEIDAL